MQHGTLHVIGVDSDQHRNLPLEVVQKCSAVVLSDRFLETLRQLDADYARYELIPITPLAEAIDKIRSRLRSGDVAVFASGDPLFFGIGRKLIDIFGLKTTRIYPAPSALQQAFARFGIPWDDFSFVSLHGRNPENHVGTLLSRARTAVLTDTFHRPDSIARDLLDFLGDDQDRYTMHVAENLGLDSERLTTGTLREIAEMQCGGLSCVVLIRSGSETSATQPLFGLTEEDILHSRGLITKSEVRAAALHALAIPANSILWDIGAGSGSVGLEAARLHRDMLVYSIEKDPEQHRNIEANKEKFAVVNLKLIKGEAPGTLQGLPRPHRVFIGGSGGNLTEIIRVCKEVILPAGRIVITAVLDQTCREAPEVLHRHGFRVTMSRIEVQRMRYPEKETTTLNPITIISGEKP